MFTNFYKTTRGETSNDEYPHLHQAFEEITTTAIESGWEYLRTEMLDNETGKTLEVFNFKKDFDNAGHTKMIEDAMQDNEDRRWGTFEQQVANQYNSSRI